MFAKLKKRIQEESGVSGTEPGEKHPQFSGVEVAPATKSSNLSYVHNADYQVHKRTSTSSLEAELQSSREKEIERTFSERPVSTSPDESMETASKEELAELLLRRTQQLKTFEAKLTELTSILKEKNQHIEKLETELERQQDLLCQRLQDLNEQYHSSRAKLSENITVAVKKREEELRLEMQEQEKAKSRLEERLTILDLEKDRFVRKAEESEAMEKAANEDRTKLRNLLLQSETEMERYKKILSEKSSNQIDRKELLDQISLLMRQKNEVDRKNQAQDDLILSLRSTNERLEKQLKESKDAYAQMAVQNSQDEWLEKQIESERVISSLEGQVSDLKFDLSQKERDRAILSQQLSDREREIADVKAEIEKIKSELRQMPLRVGQLEHENEDLSRHLDDANRDRVALRQQLDELTQEFNSLQQSLCESKVEAESATREKTELVSALELQLVQCRSSLETAQQQLSEIEEKNLKERQTFESEEVSRLKEELTDIQASLQEKNKMIKKQELRLADLKKLLQRELKVTAPYNDPNPLHSNGTGFQSSADPAFSGYADLSDSGLSAGNHSAFSAATLPITHSLTLSNSRHGKQAVGNSDGFVSRGIGEQGFEDGGSVVGQRFNPQGVHDAGVVEYDFTRELNFKYLRHVVLKFMLSRETEAIQLIKAVSMLLNFTTEEQRLIKDTLEWKMSWFGSRPQLPMKGQTAKVIPPSF